MIVLYALTCTHWAFINSLLMFYGSLPYKRSLKLLSAMSYCLTGKYLSSLITVRCRSDVLDKPDPNYPTNVARCIGITLVGRRKIY